MKPISLGSNFDHLLIPNLLDSTSVIVDAGASNGNLKQKLDESNIPFGLMFCIEPSKYNLELIPKSSKIILIERALVGIGDSHEVIYTEIEGLPEWGGIKNLNTSQGRARGKTIQEYKVQTITLANLIDEFKIKKIDYLKVDIEGAETEVIATMSGVVVDRIQQVSIEVHNNDYDFLENCLKSFNFDTIVDRTTKELYGVKANYR